MSDNTSLDLKKKIDSIRAWTRGDERAPHKPLLLLLTLGRIQRQGTRLASFAKIQEPLRNLLRDFGPSRRTYKPHMPFWRLKNDGLWDIPEANSVETTKAGDAKISSLNAQKIRAGFKEEFDRQLRNSPQLLCEIAQALLDKHFAPSLHDDILARVGLNLRSEAITKKTIRDPKFRPKVLVAYEYRCAVCGLDGRINDSVLGLEAAHVRWASHQGPSTVANGLCLCSLHHKALDTGAIGLSENHKILVSKHLHGGEQVKTLFLNYSGKPVKGPQTGEKSVSLEFIRWHQQNIFKADARPIAE